MDSVRFRAWGAEMREVHRRLRDALELARAAIEGERAADPLDGDPLLYCWGFCAALTGHHRAEDGALFPHLLELHPELRTTIDQLAQDHSMIEHLIGGLQRAVRQQAPTADKLRHLDGIEAVMETHFRYEERRLLDVLDALGGPKPTSVELFGPLA